MLLFDSSVMLFQSLVYAISKDWYTVHVIGYAGGMLLVISVHYLPESPKFHYARKEFDLAR